MKLIQSKDIEPPKQEINLPITLVMMICMSSAAIISYLVKDYYIDYNYILGGIIPIYHSIIISSILICISFYIILKLFDIHDESLSNQIGIYSGIVFIIFPHIYNSYDLIGDIIVSTNMIIIIWLICVSITKQPPYSKISKKYYSVFYSKEYNIYIEKHEYLNQLSLTLNFDYIIYFLQDKSRFINHPDKEYIIYSKHTEKTTFQILCVDGDETILQFGSHPSYYSISEEEFKIIKQIMGWKI